MAMTVSGDREWRRMFQMLASVCGLPHDIAGKGWMQ